MQQKSLQHLFFKWFFSYTYFKLNILHINFINLNSNFLLSKFAKMKFFHLFFFLWNHFSLLNNISSLSNSFNFLSKILDDSFDSWLKPSWKLKESLSMPIKDEEKCRKKAKMVVRTAQLLSARRSKEPDYTDGYTDGHKIYQNPKTKTRFNFAY